MKIKINGTEYEATLGEKILDVCRREGIKIPTLCAHGKLKREAACRLCLVETNKSDKLVTSCTFPVCEGLKVSTESERIQKARKINMELLWSDHAGKCVTCRKNRRCELQRLAEEHKIENFHFVPRKGEITDSEEQELLKDNKIRVVVDDKNPAIFRTTEFCVECRRCINICPMRAYGFNHRSGDVVVGTPYNQTLDCLFCGACVKHCPTGALTDQNDLEQIVAGINDLKKMSVAIVDPAILESVLVEFPEVISPRKLVGLLKKLGFEKVFSLDWGMEKHIELLAEEIYPKKSWFQRKKELKKVKISSHCPAFSIFINKYYPEFISNIVNIPTPDEIMAEAIREDYARKEKIAWEFFSVISFSSCVAKKTRKNNNLNYIMTVRELGRLARRKSIDAKNVVEADFDEFITPYNHEYEKMMMSGGTIELLKEKIKDENNNKFIAVNSLEEAKSVLDRIRKREASYEFIEMMICPRGCLHGGGQAISIKN